MILTNAFSQTANQSIFLENTAEYFNTIHVGLRAYDNR